MSDDNNNMGPAMTPNKPYLLRAVYEWILDNNCTPYVVIDVEDDNVMVPRQYAENGRIILNIAPVAVKDLYIDNDHLEFNARFSSQLHQIYAPMEAVMAVYARENGRGMVFGEENNGDDDGAPTPPPPSATDGSSDDGAKAPVRSKKGKPTLRVIK